jgi:hypothetical protein
MTAFKAEFVEFKQIKTRSCYQIVLEIPAEQADDALAVLGGVPKPNAQVWVAVARLNESDGARAAVAPNLPAPEKLLAPQASGPAPSDVPFGHRGPTEGERIRTRAVMLCKDEKFQEWATQYIGGRSYDHWDAEIARQVILSRCGIASRAELATNPEAQKKFLLLEAQYRAEVGNDLGS